MLWSGPCLPAGAGAGVCDQLAPFKEFPSRLKAVSFSLDPVLDKTQSPACAQMLHLIRIKMSIITPDERFAGRWYLGFPMAHVLFVNIW
jgi:hypothetical protein